MINIMRHKKMAAVMLLVLMTFFQTQAVPGAVKFVWPVPGVEDMYRGFGNGHYGLDLAADNGTKVYAAAAGTVEVVYTGCRNFDGADEGNKPCKELGICTPSKGFYKDGFCNSAYGNAVMLKHEDGTWTAYAHLTSIASGIAVGKKVNAGDLLGISGSTGRSSGAHLHFEMRTGEGEGESFWLAEAFDPLKRVTPDQTAVPKPPKKEVFSYFEGIGDVNGDGEMNAQDSLEILKTVVKIGSLDDQQMLRGDIDANGTTDAQDSLNILKVIVGLAEIRQ